MISICYDRSEKPTILVITILYLKRILADYQPIAYSTEPVPLFSIPSDSIDYIFVDPPFGSNIMYSELSLIWEGWLSILTNNVNEAIENKTQKKGSSEYRKLIEKCFSEFYRVLKPGHWMTVEFSNTKANVWSSLQHALTNVGFIVANVSALDKGRGGLERNCWESGSQTRSYCVSI